MKTTLFIIKKQAIILFLCTLIPTAKVWAQALPDSITKKVDGLFAKWNTLSSPGCVIGIVRNDSLIYAKGYGLANIEYGVSNTPETIYHMASVSKQFTAYAIVLLAKQGKLKLDDDIHKYLPWFPDLKEKITIRQLLNHTSGIRDQWQLLAISGTRLDDVIKQEQIVKVLSKQQALNFKPGEKYSYSNSGFTMLAEIVKSVTGKTLRQFTDSVIFKPLGMIDTHFHDDYTEVVKNRSYSYYPKDRGGFSNSILSYSNVGATSLFTNVNDMAKWVMNFYNHKVGTQEDIETLTQKGKFNNGKESDYALGIANNTYRGWKQYSHNGADAGYRTSVIAFPDLKMGFIVFSNVGDFNMGKMYEMANLFIKDTSKKAIDPVVSAIDSSKAILKDLTNAKKFSGDYISDDGTQFTFKLFNEKLYWERYGRSDLLLKDEKGTFMQASSPDVKFLFSTTNKGDVLVKQWWSDGERSLFKYVAVSNQTDKGLKGYTGTYYCPELDCKYGIVLKGKDLILTNNKYEDTKLKLTGKDHINTDYWWMGHLKILRGNKNQIIGFEVNDGRVMHLRFNKIQ
ncbi:serine hydrolase [Pedobacter foliorum]|uniref:serine hydrolase domain-containing protein n=1 Tax=Pedobacter foliorum TaxID=2739058 RepID=UPI0015634552|nr:serine hydrolase domain-containing protein [Pedobacter foliorum]NRF39658.1 beta-lactamase family protein [Pedobacter foliorum]